jgi:hypothetical protein
LEEVDEMRLPNAIPLLSFADVVERLRNYAGQQKLFRHDNERVAKELNELADTIEAGQKAKEEFH